MQSKEEDVLNLLSRFAVVDVPSDMHARIVCSCRSRLFTTSCLRRRNAFRVAVVCSLANIILGIRYVSGHTLLAYSNLYRLCANLLFGGCSDHFDRLYTASNLSQASVHEQFSSSHIATVV